MQLGQLFRSTPSFKGKLRLANMFCDRKLKDVNVSTRSGKFLLPNLTDNQYFEIYAKGSYEPELVKYIINTLPKNGCLLDTGANIGAVSIPVALARPDVTIVSIEALPPNFTYLEKNIQLNNLTNIIPLNVCCSNVDGKVMKFYYDDIFKGSSSFHSLHSKKYVELVTKTLDKQLSELGITKVNVFKIDTEGSEALIFQGASKLLRDMKPAILFEFNDPYENAIEGLSAGDAQQILINAGYKIYDFDKYPKAEAFSAARTKGSGEFLAIPG